jgi:hypothetical protein
MPSNLLFLPTRKPEEPLFYMSLAAFAIGAARGGESTPELEARARPPTKKNAARVV